MKSMKHLGFIPMKPWTSKTLLIEISGGFWMNLGFRDLGGSRNPTRSICAWIARNSKNHLTCHESLQVVGYLPYQLVWNIYSINTRWWQLIFFFNFHLGKIPILTNIFQGGWNHQLTDRWGPIWEVPLWRLDMSRENPENTPFAN